MSYERSSCRKIQSNALIVQEKMLVETQKGTAYFWASSDFGSKKILLNCVLLPLLKICAVAHAVILFMLRDKN